MTKSLSLAGTAFVIGASDGCLANIGSHANEPGIAALTIGTSGAVRITSPKPIFNEAAMTFSYLLDEHTYVCGGPVNNGGVALQWLLKCLLNKEDLATEDYNALFDRVDQVEAGSNGLIFLPYLTGERAPIWDSESCGTFFGLKLHHRQPHFSRAVLEGICYALNDVLIAVEQYSGTIKQINVSGGFVHSKVWMQVLADVTGKPIMLVQTEDASAIGAAYMALKVLGMSNGYLPLSSKNVETIKPDLIRHGTYYKNFQVFKQLYSNLKDTMHMVYQDQRNNSI